MTSTEQIRGELGPFVDFSFQESVQTTLDEFLSEQSSRLAPLGPDAERLLTQARLSVSGGKRLRAAFCYWGYRALRSDSVDETALFRACAALEVLHASALVHDDLMDDSDTRRGQPARHLVFASEHLSARWRGRSEQYGAAAAILLGDLLLSWADELLRNCGLPDQDLAAAMGIFDLCRSEVIVGQFLDVSVQARGQADVDTAMAVLRYKSAKYSIERPLQVGAALAGADQTHLGQLSAFGLPLGEAFQLRDDLLGVFGDPRTTGKPAGDDLVQGKRTVLIALALNGAPTPEAELLDQWLGLPLAPDQIDRLRGIIESSGARAHVEEAIEGLTARARAALERSDIDEQARRSLHALAAAVTDRAR
ncbi:MAG: polyprenyl synthetase family protein [Nocardioides sp.]